MRGPLYIYSRMGFDLQTDMLPGLERLFQEPCCKCHSQHFPGKHKLKHPLLWKGRSSFPLLFLSVFQKIDFKLFTTESSQTWC